MARLWRRMGRIYGHRWASQYGAADDGTWAAALADLAEDELFAGLRACALSGDGWPPTLPEFRALCRPTRREHAAAYRTAPPAIERKLSDEARAVGRAHVARLREGLK